MRALTCADPAPSMLRYRFERLWLKPSVRALVKFWLPLALVGAALWWGAGNPVVAEGVRTRWQALRDTVAARPELQVVSLHFYGASPDLQAQIAAVAPLKLPQSAMDLDVGALKTRIEMLDAVKSAQVAVLDDGRLEITVEERIPALVWRDGARLRLIDETGVGVADIARRAARPDLPLIVGQGADKAVAEVAPILEILTPVLPRLRGLVRVGERRWDVVLDHNQRIMLPETGTLAALRRVLEMHSETDLLNRDVTVVDMRNPARPVLRLSDNAMKELRRLRTIPTGEDA